MNLDAMQDILAAARREEKPFWEIILETDMENRQVSRRDSVRGEPLLFHPEHHAFERAAIPVRDPQERRRIEVRGGEDDPRDHEGGAAGAPGVRMRGADDEHRDPDDEQERRDKCRRKGATHRPIDLFHRISFLFVPL